MGIPLWAITGSIQPPSGQLPLQHFMVSMDVEIVEHNSKDEVIETIVACHYHRKILTHPTLNGGRGEIREKAPTVDRGVAKAAPLTLCTPCIPAAYTPVGP